AVGNGLDNILTGNSGNNSLNGGAGSDTFRFLNNSGADTIQGFENGSDRFDFASHTLVNSIANLTISTSGADALVTFAGGQFTVLGAAGLIEASDFVFA
ncbi:MAG: alkaline metalloproteinase, partial [Hoeflea sp.]|nr:alkaline metalloproteinase [Hoeflea sp.]